MALVLRARPGYILQVFNSLSKQTVLASKSGLTCSAKCNLSTFKIRLKKLLKGMSWMRNRSYYRYGSLSSGSLPAIKNQSVNVTSKCLDNLLGEFSSSLTCGHNILRLCGSAPSSLLSTDDTETPSTTFLCTSTYPQLLKPAFYQWKRSGNIVNYPKSPLLASPKLTSEILSIPSHISRAFHSHDQYLNRSSNPIDQKVTHFSTGQSQNASHDLGLSPGHLLAGPKDLMQKSHQGFGSCYSTASQVVDSSPKAMQPYLRLIRMDKPIGTWLLYWPCTWSIALASQPGSLPDPYLLALFGAGAFFMRGAGCIINDMWDKDFDEKVERTKTRPLANGDLTHFQALVFLGGQLSCALAILLQLNLYSVILGAASMSLVVTYPLAKRYTYWPQFILGLTFNYGVLLGYSAVAGSVNWAVCLPMYFASVLWTLVYDTVYAHQDKHDDLLIGVKSAAIRLGEQTKPVLTAFTGAMAAGLVISGQLSDMTWPYYLAVALTTGRLAQQVYITDLDTADDCAHAFRGNFYLGAVMFMGIVLSNYLKQETTENTEETPAEKLQAMEERETLSSLTSKDDMMTEIGKDKKDTVFFMSR